MKIWKKIVVYGLLAVVFLIGICFPSMVGSVQDIQIGRMRDQVEAKTVQLKMSSNLSVVQKLVVVKAGAYSAVELESAQKMEYQEAYKAVNEGLDAVLAIFPPFSKAKFSEKEHSIELRMYEENSVILWNFVFEDEDHRQIHVLLDDDTGLILAYQYLLNTSVNYDLSESASDSGSSITSASASVYDEVESTGYDLTNIAEPLAVSYSEYLGVVISGIDLSKTKTGTYVAWIYDMEGAEDCDIEINITGTEFSVNF